MPRPRLQFSLRTLLIAITRFSIGMGIIAGVTGQALNSFSTAYLAMCGACGASCGVDNSRKGFIIVAWAVSGAGIGYCVLLFSFWFMLILMEMG
jgi:hypothetical protein